MLFFDIKVLSHYAALYCKCMWFLNAACDELRCAQHLHVGVFTVKDEESNFGEMFYSRI